LGSQLATWSRLPIGAAAGLTVWLFSVATVQASADLNIANLLLAAFGAGFAERLIVQGSGPQALQPGHEPSTGLPPPTENDHVRGER
jgi:ABC-type uncharacterized transport system permease subunit